MPYLTIQQPDGQESRAAIGQADVTIGRHANSSLRIDAPWISLEHARISSHEAQHVLVDLGSENGTFVNYEAIARVALADNDLIFLGRTRLIYRAGDRLDDSAVELDILSESAAGVFTRPPVGSEEPGRETNELLQNRETREQIPLGAFEKQRQGLRDDTALTARVAELESVVTELSQRLAETRAELRALTQANSAPPPKA